ncbi:MAG: hypothetical protein U9R46_11395, partial [Bacteroidota bacterium]|nr:hypothetical protein [Bacteroidota bacterium]
MKKTAYDIAFQNALIEEHNKIFSDNGTLKTEYAEILNKCPVCSSTKNTIYCIKDSFNHKKCDECGLIFVDPRLNATATISFYNSAVNEVYNEEKFHNENKTGPDDLANLNNFKILRKYLKDDIKGKKLLEIGCGKGTFLKTASDAGFDVYGIEVNNVLTQKLKQITP